MTDRPTTQIGNYGADYAVAYFEEAGEISPQQWAKLNDADMAAFVERVGENCLRSLRSALLAGTAIGVLPR